ncbi:MAG: hypothetical protein JST11_23905 [Acidobacteria bacterium]|nr:hypothetical protein [Acidobacteriota bacterium]
MKSFRFPLEKALEWRRKQLELEEARFRRQAAAVAALDRERAETEAAGIRAEIQVRQWGSVAGSDLAALDHFRLRVKNDEARIARDRAAAAAELAVRQESMLEARRRATLLERLRERRYKEWEAERDRELDEIAAESYLARWSRREADAPPGAAHEAPATG